MVIFFNQYTLPHTVIFIFTLYVHIIDNILLDFMEAKYWTKDQTIHLVNLRHSPEFDRKFKSSIYKKMELWNEIGMHISKSGFKCDKKYRYLKKRNVAIYS